MCMEALHWIAYEKIHGTGSFSCKVADTAAQELKKKMRIGEGGAFPDDVLKEISSNMGLPTIKNIIRLTSKNYETMYTADKKDAAQVTVGMLKEGPIVEGMVYGAGVNCKKPPQLRTLIQKTTTIQFFF
ncbi:hypothetical protein CFC21_087307 [Triticum aestivum]|uniref:Uncharacterized protein n=2 Tax=Triticum aestivum TaxID=4565 RepID=A0A3B6PIC3_WHEAT|nr:hypothetical protein CFC21_087307 [Triticum aestivum]